jgi:hypothetical protein
MKKKTRLVNGIMIVSMVPLLTALGVLISAMAGYSWPSDLAFIIPMFLGTAIFFVGTYLEAKHEPTFGIPLYVSNRKVKMRTAISGCIMSVVMSILSLFII